MNRSRAWRRHKRESKIISRLKRLSNRHWWRLKDANGINIPSPVWTDFIATDNEFDIKSQSTVKYDTRYKTKWGKKGKRNYDYSSDYHTRIKDKVRFQKLLKEELSELN